MSDVVELLRAGLPHKVIARRTGCTLSAVKSRARRCGISGPRLRRDRIRAWLVAGLTIAEAARRTGVTYEAARHIARVMRAE